MLDECGDVRNRDESTRTEILNAWFRRVAFSSLCEGGEKSKEKARGIMEDIIHSSKMCHSTYSGLGR